MFKFRCWDFDEGENSAVDVTVHVRSHQVAAENFALMLYEEGDACVTDQVRVCVDEYGGRILFFVASAKESIEIEIAPPDGVRDGEAIAEVLKERARLAAEANLGEDEAWNLAAALLRDEQQKGRITDWSLGPKESSDTDRPPYMCDVWFSDRTRQVSHGQTVLEAARKALARKG